MNWAISENTNPVSEELFQALIAATPVNKAILEFGSGYATEQMIKWRRVYSIEHNQQWCGKYHEQYLYVPMDNTGYYDSNLLAHALNYIRGSYGSVLVDGPDRDSRMDLMADFLERHPDALDTSVPWFFDDVAWAPFREGIKRVEELRGVKMFRFEITAKCWGVIPAVEAK